MEGALELNQLDGGHGELGLSYFECEVISDWKARCSGTSWMADTGSWHCLISNARSLQTGRRVGMEPAGWRTRGVGTVLFRMRGHFRLEGALEWNQLDGGHGEVGTVLFRMRGHFRLEGALELNQLDGGYGELGLSYFECEVISDWKARWS